MILIPKVNILEKNIEMSLKVPERDSNKFNLTDTYENWKLSDQV